MAEATKSLAAEIEAVLRDQIVLRWMGPDSFVEGHEEAARKIAARIAALQGRAFEDGARWMRAAMADAILADAQRLSADEASAHSAAIKAIRALPLQPEGESDA